jgi:hypothetical protein
MDARTTAGQETGATDRELMAKAMEQGLRRDAGVGVRAAGLPESGSGFAVVLIHIRAETSCGGPGRVLTACGGKRGLSAGRYVEKRMLSQRECERRVTGSTEGQRPGTKD